MYPNLYYAFADIFGIELPFLKLVNSFGFFVAMAFLIAGYILRIEFIRFTNNGWLTSSETTEIVGKRATPAELISQGFIGFIFGWKFLYLAFNAGDLFDGTSLPQSHLFSNEGSIPFGIILALAFAGYRYWESNKNALNTPEARKVSIPPSEHTGSIMTVAAVGGILGAKLFHLIEYPDQFVAFFKNPSLNAFIGGLTIYGGLIVGGLSVWIYTKRQGFNFLRVADAAAPSLMLGYGIGRIGCQVSGDGDWGINNPAPPPDWMSFLPDWVWSYQFPNNVNGVGRLITETDPWPVFPGYGTCLDIPVYPTSLYETTAAIILFSILWLLRKRINTTGIIFSIYLMMNGFERFWIEKIRVNAEFDLLGITMTQAELIATILMVSGAILFLYLRKNSKTA
jgi:prolipoprotein diacylglyceryl transferase